MTKYNTIYTVQKKSINIGLNKYVRLCTDSQIDRDG